MIDVNELITKSELEVEKQFKEIERLEQINSEKVLNAFWNNNVNEIHFNTTTGYGYNDTGRDVIEKVFATVIAFAIYFTSITHFT